LDDLTSSFLEVITSTGKYFWVPLEKIQRLEFRPPRLTRDLIWRSAQIEVAGGPDGEVYIPVLYPTAPPESDPQLLLGRGTEWIGGKGAPVRGIGQRTFLVGDSDRPILELGELVFLQSETQQSS
jgi:type VI secretion system protein ImpE